MSRKFQDRTLTSPTERMDFLLQRARDFDLQIESCVAVSNRVAGIAMLGATALEAAYAAYLADDIDVDEFEQCVELALADPRNDLGPPLPKK